jgi:hypothetical protein
MRMTSLQRVLRGWSRKGSVRLFSAGLPGLLAGLAAALGLSSAPYAPVTTPTTGTAPYSVAPTPVAASNPLTKRGMWIWELGDSSGGNVAAIIARAKADGVGTLMIKSSDGTAMWPQFNATLVRELHADGLKVCAWQYVYGSNPLAEAAAGARAVKDGADCLMIDAEAEYQGKYVAAQKYITRLRHLIGKNFPVALAGLPYVDFHPAFPYSVFLGPGGAQYNAPQMYWRAIGVTPDAVFAHTYEFNEIYQRPIFPLGQIYDSPPVRQVLRFRELSRLYGASNVSWWDWQSASPQSRYFKAISQNVATLKGSPDHAPATVALHAEGDLVVWGQEHLVAAARQLHIDGRTLTIDGAFGAKTLAAVEAFQVAKGLPVTGELDPPTWVALLGYQPIIVRWVTRRHKTVAVTATARTDTGGAETAVVPRSASLPSRGRDIPAGLGAGHP